MNLGVKEWSYRDYFKENEKNDAKFCLYIYIDSWVYLHSSLAILLEMIHVRMKAINF